ncbi:MAG: C4-dicarboxylate ABC transporter permease [Pelagibacterium sp. SCN 63-23]|nr:MAG: C4-dicarboxylate ABC transporter permease [Pelagibacterium sp. SCN 63-23]
MLRVLARLHDGVTRLTFWGAAISVFYLTAITAYEVVSRYFFRAPSDWAPDTSAVAFAFIAFLAAPELTRHSGHAAMTFVVEGASPAVSRWMTRLGLSISAVVCLVLTWFGGIEAGRQIAGNVAMIAATPIPKWIVTGAIVYGLASSALYFIRHLLASFFPSNKDASKWSGTFS